jgi:hypothetical protein
MSWGCGLLSNSNSSLSCYCSTFVAVMPFTMPVSLSSWCCLAFLGAVGMLIANKAILLLIVDLFAMPFFLWVSCCSLAALFAVVFQAATKKAFPLPVSCDVDLRCRFCRCCFLFVSKGFPAFCFPSSYHLFL